MFLILISLFLVTITPTDTQSECSSVPKLGSCPPTLINPDQTPCNSNLDCSGNRLCCYGGESTSRCTDPLETKGYDCPNPDQIQNGTTTCLLDSECPGEEKCCLESPCSYTCTPPVKNELQVDFRLACSPPVIPPEARCPFPPFLTVNLTPCGSHADCATNGNERMCCSDGNGGKICAEPLTNRVGTCPPAPQAMIDGNPCILDTNCPGNQRCCVGPTGTCFTCMRPTTTAGPTECFSIDKLGACPALLINEGRAPCSAHSDCPGNQLCCRRSFGTESRCSDPFSSITGFCPSPGSIPLTRPCAIDSDCTTGFKCCAVTNCSYYCAPVSSSTRDPYYCGTSPDKYGACPPTPINPTAYCRMSSECPGRQLCCSNTCSDPVSDKRGKCPSPDRVSRGPTRCLVDQNCSGASNRKCCPDSNCQYYCSYTDM